MPTMTKAKLAEREEARAELRELLPVGSTVDVIQRHVSRSGMMRYLSLRAGSQDITWLVARATSQTCHDYHGYWAVKAKGCGMDMHFHEVYNLSRTLYPNGAPCTGQDSGPNRCPSNDHVNDRERDYDTSRRHGDGGYSIKHRTI